jgi:TATA-box binding protein (TBP) (component of TFIID and TFIIIB)
MNENEKDLRLTDFDYRFADPKLQMVKAAIPYLSVPQQRVFALMVRLQETRRTMELLSSGEMAAMGISSDSSKSHSFLEILQAIKPYAGPREREVIENFENMHLMIQAMQTSS